MKKSLNLFAAAAILGSTAIAPIAFAQTATTDPAMPKVETPATNGLAPSSDTMAPADAKPMDTMATTMDTYLTEQSTTQVSANEYIGSSIYNSQDESIGDINDLIIEEDGKVVAAIVGVGGFLGIGEKDVAVPMSKIDVTHVDGGDDLKLTTVETAESLKAAPAYKTLDQQKAEADNTQIMPADNTTTSSTVKN